MSDRTVDRGDAGQAGEHDEGAGVESLSVEQLVERRRNRRSHVPDESEVGVVIAARRERREV